ncbi:hypothetical protein [Algibacter sp. Ld11]|uniref:hypothetical protein n=1 Tax=Algibacter sp. Ld11 TaxID=649150 RepID=UPI003862E146
MEKKNLKSEKDFIKAYQENGFTGNFMMVNHKLVGTETKTEYYPMDINVVAEHRFEGMSNPSDMSILYVIETKDGLKGTVLANYSPSSNTSTAEFFKAIPKENISQKANFLN